MSLNNTPSADRTHIGFFGKRNAGKSSLLNAVIDQDFAVVSDVKGTTTDPVYKAMELLPLGPVMIIDTPGIDDEGTLGEMRVKKAKQVLNKTDIAILVKDATETFSEEEENLIKLFEQKEVPFITVYNKSDLLGEIPVHDENSMYVSALKKDGITELKEMMARIGKTSAESKKIVSDLLEKNDFVVLVTPIDESAPKGRLILPQQQTIRDIIDAGAIAIVSKETELEETLKGLAKRPRMVITDSQVFEKVSAIVPDEIELTSFSILMARYKGFLESAVHGVSKLRNLNDGDTVLISEGCTHHRQCNDIGTVKMPRWIEDFCQKKLNFEFSSGTGFPEDLSKYSLIVHCGGCMLNERELRYRMKCANDQNIPFTNYGTTIAYIHGILKRSLRIFPDLEKYL